MAKLSSRSIQRISRVVRQVEGRLVGSLSSGAATPGHGFELIPFKLKEDFPQNEGDDIKSAKANPLVLRGGEWVVDSDTEVTLHDAIGFAAICRKGGVVFGIPLGESGFQIWVPPEAWIVEGTLQSSLSCCGSASISTKEYGTITIKDEYGRVADWVQLPGGPVPAGTKVVARFVRHRGWILWFIVRCDEQCTSCDPCDPCNSADCADCSACEPFNDSCSGSCDQECTTDSCTGDCDCDGDTCGTGDCSCDVECNCEGDQCNCDGDTCVSCNTDTNCNTCYVDVCFYCDVDVCQNCEEGGCRIDCGSCLRECSCDSGECSTECGCDSPGDTCSADACTCDGDSCQNCDNDLECEWCDIDTCYFCDGDHCSYCDEGGCFVDCATCLFCESCYFCDAECTCDVECQSCYGCDTECSQCDSCETDTCCQHCDLDQCTTCFSCEPDCQSCYTCDTECQSCYSCDPCDPCECDSGCMPCEVCDADTCCQICDTEPCTYDTCTSCYLCDPSG